MLTFADIGDAQALASLKGLGFKIIDASKHNNYIEINNAAMFLRKDKGMTARKS